MDEAIRIALTILGVLSKLYDVGSEYPIIWTGGGG